MAVLKTNTLRNGIMTPLFISMFERMKRDRHFFLDKIERERERLLFFSCSMNNSDEITLFLEGPSILVNERGRTLRELLLDLFHRSQGENICGILGDDRLTIGMLFEGAEKVSARMKNECCVGVCMDLSLELIIVLCGLILCGVKYVPLEPRLPKERLTYILEDSQASILITNDQNILSHWNENIPIDHISSN